MDFTYDDDAESESSGFYSGELTKNEQSLLNLSSFGSEFSGEQSTTSSRTEDEEEISSGETQNYRSQNICRTVLTVILIGLVCGVTAVLFTQITNLQDLSKTEMENTEMKKMLGLNVTTTKYVMSLSTENTQLKLLLQNTMTEQDSLKRLLILIQENYNLLIKANKGLNHILNQSLHIINLSAEESEQWRLHLNYEIQTSRNLGLQNQLQRSVLFANKLSFIWRYCDNATLECSTCMSGWTEHNSHCFFMPQDTKTWRDARRTCLDVGGDLAVVLNEQDHLYLTQLIYQFGQHYPEQRVHSAWIGLQDMDEEGNTTHIDDIHWMNNTIVFGNINGLRQGCVAIVPPINETQERNNLSQPLNNINCTDRRHYLCETTAFILS